MKAIKANYMNVISETLVYFFQSTRKNIDFLAQSQQLVLLAPNNANFAMEEGPPWQYFCTTLQTIFRCLRSINNSTGEQ